MQDRELAAEAQRGIVAPARTLTLLDLVCELCDTGASDSQVVAAVFELVETRRVQLVGQVLEADLCRGSGTGFP